MSLIHWWPLTGHARDMVGNKHGELIGSPSLTETGKIGYCYSTNTTNTYKSGQGVNIPNCNLINELGSEYSFACWFKVHGTHPDYNGTIMSSGNWNTQCWAVGISKDNTQIDVFCDHYNQWLPIGYTLSNNVWYHLVSAQKNGINYVYLNGELLGTRNSTALHRTDYSNLCIGRETYAGGYFGFNGDINDIRVYNHCLSPREVKLLAQGLVAHYKLETYTPNLLNNAEKYTYSSPLTKTSSSKDGYSTTDMYCQVIPGETYYFSCETDGEWYQHNTGGVDPSNKYATLWFYLTKTYDPSNTGYDNPICLTKAMGDGRWIYKIPEGYNGLRIRTNTYSNGTDAVTIKFWNFYLSKGTVIVPEASQKYDCSGYNHHLLQVGSVINTNTSPRYLNAVNFNQTGYFKIDNFNLTAPQFTCAFWVKAPSTTTDQHFLFGTHNNWTNNGLSAWRDKNGSSYSMIIRSDAETSHSGFGFSFSANTWEHIVYTYTGTEVIGYRNGIEFNRSTYGKNGNVILPVIYLGNSLYSNAPASEIDEASMSDFRIYATALSAAAVKELHQSSISFLDNGTLQCSEIVENNTNLKYNQNGIVQANQLNEIGYVDKMKVKTLSDGSAWARIHWLDVTTNTTAYFANEAEVQECVNQTNRFSLIKYINKFKSKNNQYEFMLTYPKISTTLYNRWTQNTFSNNVNDGDSIVFNLNPDSAWKGHAGPLKRAQAVETIYDCDNKNTGNWYAPIGQVSSWGASAIPAANESSTTETELWVRIDNLPKLTKLSMLDDAIQAFQIYEL